MPFFDIDLPRREIRRDYVSEVFESMEKKDLLRLELENAEWILEYEKKLHDLRKKIATQKEQTASTGGDIRRLKQLDAYLENLGRNLSLD